MDGQSERTNQWLEQYLCFWVNERQDNWAAYLPMAEFMHNNWLNETTHESPFFLLMGYNPRADWTDRLLPIPQVALHLEQFKQARKRAQELMIKAQKSWVKHKDTPKYQVGDQVWLEGCHLRTNQPTAKLAPRRHGPFKVIQVMSDVNYRLQLPTQWSIHPVFHTDLLTPYRETPTHGRNYQHPPPELVDREEEYEVEKILDQRHFGRRRRLQYLVKWKGYSDSENQWVDSTDVFADEAIREFQNSNPTSSIHKSKRKSHQNQCLLLSLLAYMTSPSPLPTPPRHANSTPLDVGTTDYSVSRIFGMLVKPKRGQVSPDFLEYQDTGVEGGNDQVEARTDGASPAVLEVPVRIPSTSDIAEVRCHPDDHLSPNLPSEYHHDEYDNQFHFVPNEHARQVHEAVAREAAAATTWEAECTPLTPYVATDTEAHDSDKENRNPNQEDSEDAKGVPRSHQDAQRMGPCRQGRRGGRGRNSVGEAEDGPIRLYHPWNQRSIGVQRSEAPVPEGYERNDKHNYIPFPITNEHGCTVPAKYVAVFMAANPYALGKLTSDGPAYTGEIHAAPCFDYKAPDSVQDLKELLPTWYQFAEVDTALSRIKDRSLTAEVLRYHHLMGRLRQLDEQMATIEKEMATLIPQKHQCVDRLMRAQAVRRVRKEIGQRIRTALPWEEELSLQSNLGVQT